MIELMGAELQQAKRDTREEWERDRERREAREARNTPRRRVGTPACMTKGCRLPDGHGPLHASQRERRVAQLEQRAARRRPRPTRMVRDDRGLLVEVPFGPAVPVRRSPRVLSVVPKDAHGRPVVAVSS